MSQSFQTTFRSIPVLLLVLGSAACTAQQNRPHTAESEENLPPNSADIHEQEMKESEEVAEERREDALEDATDGVDNASVIKSDEGDLKTEDVNTDPKD